MSITTKSATTRNMERRAHRAALTFIQKQVKMNFYIGGTTETVLDEDIR